MNRKWFFPFPIEVTKLIFYIVLGQIFDVLNFARIGNGLDPLPIHLKKCLE